VRDPSVDKVVALSTKKKGCIISARNSEKRKSSKGFKKEGREVCFKESILVGEMKKVIHEGEVSMQFVMNGGERGLASNALWYFCFVGVCLGGGGWVGEWGGGVGLGGGLGVLQGDLVSGENSWFEV